MKLIGFACGLDSANLRDIYLVYLVSLLLSSSTSREADHVVADWRWEIRVPSEGRLWETLAFARVFPMKRFHDAWVTEQLHLQMTTSLTVINSGAYSSSNAHWSIYITIFPPPNCQTSNQPGWMTATGATPAGISFAVL